MPTDAHRFAVRRLLAAGAPPVQEHGTRGVLVTSSDGRLVGLPGRADARRALGRQA